MKYLLLALALFSNSVWATSHALYQYSTSEYIDKKDTDTIRSIASITKLFTAMTVLTSSQDLEEKIMVDCRNRGHVSNGMELSRRDLLTAAIVVSDNCAAETLANNYPGGYSRFIFDRSKLLSDLGLHNTHLFDPTGLSVFNVSTVDDLIKFAPVAYSNEFLRTIANLPQATIKATRKGRSISITVRNTNPAIFSHNDIVVSKTGFTNTAGRCVLMLVKRVQDLYAVVVLGELNIKSRTKAVELLLSKK
jgi:D-alanyl-D-alanine endopeptidase (penicillin-binding protein 7)